MSVLVRLKGNDLLPRLGQSIIKQFFRSTTDITDINLDNDDFRKFLHYYQKILVLTGAGISTDSGIPDYRSQDGLFNRNSYKPVQFSEFLNNIEARRRFWARNYIAWPNFSSCIPNEGHFYLCELEYKTDKILSIVTQNVDGLHRKAGSHNVIELHGNAFWVRCLNCGDTISRYDFQRTLYKYNPLMQVTSDELRPDGDIELKQSDVEGFVVPDCEKCGGILKPTVVFFGENVPQKRVEKVEKLVEECDSILIIGTTASTLSSFRIIEKAYDLCKFLCLVNFGPTKIDNMVDLKFDLKIKELLSRLALQL